MSLVQRALYCVKPVISNHLCQQVLTGDIFSTTRLHFEILALDLSSPTEFISYVMCRRDKQPEMCQNGCSHENIQRCCKIAHHSSSITRIAHDTLSRLLMAFWILIATFSLVSIWNHCWVSSLVSVVFRVIVDWILCALICSCSSESANNRISLKYIIIWAMKMLTKWSSTWIGMQLRKD